MIEPIFVGNVTETTIVFMSYISMLITLVGSIAGAGFYIEKRHKQRLDDNHERLINDHRRFIDTLAEIQYGPLLQEKQKRGLPDLRDVHREKFHLHKW